MYFHYFTLFFVSKIYGTSFRQTSVYFTKGCSAPSLVILAQLFLSRRLLNFDNVYLLFHNHRALEKSLFFNLVPFTQGCFIPTLDEIGSAVLMKFLKVLYQYVPIVCLWIYFCRFIWTRVPLTRGCCVPSWLKLNVWFWRTEDLFFLKRQCIFNNPLICFLLKKDVTFLLNRLESPLFKYA